MTRQQIIASLRGIFTPLVTPFNRRGGIDEGLFRENAQRLTGIGLGGLLVAGSTGEAPFLSEPERLRLVEIARDVMHGPELLMVGTGLEGTEATVQLSRQVVARGADVLLVLTPNYYKPRMDGETLARYYRAVAAGLSRPVVIYSIPQFTGLNPEAATIARLSRIPNVVGLKESSGNLLFVRSVLRKVRRGFRVLVGSVTILYDALRAGAVGGVLGQSNFAPDLCVGLYEAYLRGRARQAREFQRRLQPLAEKISVPYGVSGMKAALDLCGYAGGFPRAPLLPLSRAQRQGVAAALREARAGLEY